MVFNLFNISPIGSYVNAMSADGGHFGWLMGSSDIIMKGDHLSPNWQSSFRGDFKTFRHLDHKMTFDLLILNKVVVFDIFKRYANILT